MKDALPETVSYREAQAACTLLEQQFGPRVALVLAAVHFSGSDPFHRYSAHLPAELWDAAPKRRNEYLAGRYCAVRALARAGCLSRAWPDRDNDGLPRWPSGWIGSVSHTAVGAVAAVARCQPHQVLGVDMERLINPADCEAIAAVVAQPGELALLGRLPLDQALTLLFSAKEALYKALYPLVRQFFDFSAARAIQRDDRNLTLLLTKSWSDEWPQGTQVSVAYVFVGDHVYTAVWQCAVASNSSRG